MKTDAQLELDVTHELEWDPSINATAVGVGVKDGVVTLSGQVEWDFQRIAAAKAVRPLRGVAGLDNRITIKPQANPGNISQSIRDALARHAERNAVQGAAWSAAGVTDVVNRLTVGTA